MTTWRTGWCSGPVDRQWKAKAPSMVPATKASSAALPSGATVGIDVATADRSRAARASAAPARRRSTGRASPTPTSSTSRSAGLAAVPRGTGHLDDLADGARHLPQLGDAEQVDLDRLDQVGRTRAEQDVLLALGGAGQDRQRHGVDSDDGGREELAQRELGG